LASQLQPCPFRHSGILHSALIRVSDFVIPLGFGALVIGISRLALRSFRTDNAPLPLSARNQFPGKILSIRNGAVMSEVVIDIGHGHQIVSLISASSVKRLKLKKGGSAVAVIKATEVIISTDSPSAS
jgi:molybdopterin-binding protein